MEKKWKQSTVTVVVNFCFWNLDLLLLWNRAKTSTAQVFLHPTDTIFTTIIYEFNVTRIYPSCEGLFNTQLRALYFFFHFSVKQNLLLGQNDKICLQCQPNIAIWYICTSAKLKWFFFLTYNTPWIFIFQKLVSCSLYSHYSLCK